MIRKTISGCAVLSLIAAMTLATPATAHARRCCRGRYAYSGYSSGYTTGYAQTTTSPCAGTPAPTNPDGSIAPQPNTSTYTPPPAPENAPPPPAPSNSQ